MSAELKPEIEAPDGYKKVQVGPQIEVIPDEWKKVRVDEVTENLDRQRDPIKSSERTDGDVPYYGATGQVDSVKDYIFDEKLVLVGEDGANWSPFGGTSYIISGKSWVNNHVHILRATEIVAEYLQAYIDYVDMRHVITGSTRGKLNKGELNRFPILYPSLPEQRRIADILSTVDEQIQQTDKIIETRQEQIQGLIDELVKIGVRYSPDTHNVQIGPKQVEIPTDWELFRVDELVTDDDDAIRTGPFGSKLKKEYLVSEGIKVYEQSNVYDNNFNQGDRYVTPERYESELTSYDANPGDVLITLQGTIGDAAVLPENAEPGVINQKLMRVRVDHELCLPEYFTLFFDESHLANFQIEAVSHGAVVSGLNISTISGIQVPLPTLSEQQKIVDIVKISKTALAEEQETKVRLQELKRGLMQDLLTGKVRVNTDD